MPIPSPNRQHQSTEVTISGNENVAEANKVWRQTRLQLQTGCRVASSRVRNCVFLYSIFGCETVLFYRVTGPCINAHRPKCRALRRPPSQAAPGEHGIRLPRHRDAGPSSSNHSSTRCGVTFGRPTQRSAVGIVAVSCHRFTGETITPQWV